MACISEACQVTVDLLHESPCCKRKKTFNIHQQSLHINKSLKWLFDSDGTKFQHYYFSNMEWKPKTLKFPHLWKNSFLTKPEHFKLVQPHKNSARNTPTPSILIGLLGQVFASWCSSLHHVGKADAVLLRETLVVHVVELLVRQTWQEQTLPWEQGCRT